MKILIKSKVTRTRREESESCNLIFDLPPTTCQEQPTRRVHRALFWIYSLPNSVLCFCSLEWLSGC